MPIDAIFFDAGNTLVFPDPSLTLAPLADHPVRPTQEQLFGAERHAKHQLDAGHSHGDFGVDAHYWQTFYAHLLHDMGVAHDAALLDALAAASRRSANWRTVRPGTHETLSALRDRYRLAVISNSDGTVASLLDELGLGGYFESVTDSHICGCEKPDPRIFHSALQSLGVPEERAIYIGDLYSVDFVGARRVGMAALLMDAAGVYAGTNYPRITSLDEVESYVELLSNK